MQEHVGLALTMIIALGVASQWIAWRLNIPSIVLLLLTVLTVGPLTGWIDIDALVPPRLLDPCVSMAVAIVLFEGGLQLKTRDIVGYHRVILLMVSLGALLCWGLCSLFAVLILGLPMGGLFADRGDPDRHWPHCDYATGSSYSTHSSYWYTAQVGEHHHRSHRRDRRCACLSGAPTTHSRQGLTGDW